MTPIPRARNFSSQHFTADDHYTASPLWQADATDGPVDKSLESWEESLPAQQQSQAFRCSSACTFARINDPFSSTPAWLHPEDWVKDTLLQGHLFRASSLSERNARQLVPA